MSTSYALITAARDEASFIRLTVESVISQSVRPIKWIIVSDGSTDGTDEIIREYAQCNDWIELIRMPERQDREFGGKARAFNQGLEHLRGVNCKYIGSVDADISFEPDYFEFLLSKLDADPELGVAGTPFREGKQTYDYRYVSIEHVSGACQMFRRKCLEEIGGYVAMRRGGVDHVAVLKARMLGWKTRTFTEKVCEHHRLQGSATRGIIRSRIHLGKLDYALGAHPLWELCRACYQMSKPPLILGGALIFIGYFSSMFARAERAVTSDLVAFRRQEQMRRLKQLFLDHVSGLSGPPERNAS